MLVTLHKQLFKKINAIVGTGNIQATIFLFKMLRLICLESYKENDLW